MNMASFLLKRKFLRHEKLRFPWLQKTQSGPKQYINFLNNFNFIFSLYQAKKCSWVSDSKISHLYGC